MGGSRVVGVIGLHGGMTNTSLRSAADAVLRRLVGDDTGTARLREDQWRAIEALVADRRRALVVSETHVPNPNCTSPAFRLEQRIEGVT